VLRLHVTYLLGHLCVCPLSSLESELCSIRTLPVRLTLFPLLVCIQQGWNMKPWLLTFRIMQNQKCNSGTCIANPNHLQCNAYSREATACLTQVRPPATQRIMAGPGKPSQVLACVNNPDHPHAKQWFRPQACRLPTLHVTALP
jgi:hypothetical protein